MTCCVVVMGFGQTGILIVGSNTAISWLSLLQMQPHNSAGFCVVELDPTQKFALDAVVPILYFACLLVIALLHWLIWVLRKNVLAGHGHGGPLAPATIAMRPLPRFMVGQEEDGPLSPTSPMSPTTPTTPTQMAAAGIDPNDFPWYSYTRTAGSLLLLAYMPLSQFAFAVLDCKKYDQIYLMTTQPAIQCYNKDWVKLLVVSIIMLLTITLGVPVFLILFLLKHRKTMKQDATRMRTWWGTLFEGTFVRRCGYMLCVQRIDRASLSHSRAGC